MFHIAVEHFTDGRRLHFDKWRMIFFKFSESSTSRSTAILHIVRKRNGPKIPLTLRNSSFHLQATTQDKLDLICTTTTAEYTTLQ